MTQARLMELSGESYRTVVRIDWMLVVGLIAAMVGTVCLALDLDEPTLRTIVKFVRG